MHDGATQGAAPSISKLATIVALLTALGGLIASVTGLLQTIHPAAPLSSLQAGSVAPPAQSTPAPVQERVATPAPETLHTVATAPQSHSAASAPDILSSVGSCAGPSYDCRLAANSAERLICDDPALACLDMKMSVVFNMRRVSLSGDALASYKREQRDWISRRNTFCAQDSLSERRACIAGYYHTRIAELKR